MTKIVFYAAQILWPINGKRSKKMKPIRLYLFFVILLSACSTVTDISGNYYSRRTPYSFKLNKDSTFFYRFKFEIGYEYSLGRWNRASRNAVILNSYYREKLLQLKVEHSNASGSHTVNLNIVTPDFDRKYYECLIFVNGILYAKQKCDSAISVSIKKPVENVFLAFTADRTIDPLLATRALDTVYTEKFYSKIDAFDTYTLRIAYNDSLFNYRVFNNEIIKITKKGLIFYDSTRRIRQTLSRQ